MRTSSQVIFSQNNHNNNNNDDNNDNNILKSLGKPCCARCVCENVRCVILCLSVLVKGRQYLFVFNHFFVLFFEKTLLDSFGDETQFFDNYYYKYIFVFVLIEYELKV